MRWLSRLRRLVPSTARRAPRADPDAAEPQLLAWPLDHYYSPVPDSRALAHEPAYSRVWPPVPRTTPGIDWRDEEQVALVKQLGGLSGMDFAEEPTGDARDYYVSNGMFSPLDAWALQSMLRHFRPRRMIEVGSGFSSLVTARVNREYLDGSLDFTCIEPYPSQFLQAGVEDHLAARESAHDLGREVVRGGSEAAAGDDQGHALALHALLQWFVSKTTCQAPLGRLYGRLYAVILRRLGLHNRTYKQVQKP